MNTLELAVKRDCLLAVLQDMQRVAVAFSGGVDSAVVAKAAALVLGAEAVAVTAVSASLAQGELEAASELAATIGIRHVVMRTEEFAVPGYIENAGNRCYFCKTELYSQIVARRAELQVEFICNGANLDDLGDYRPGLQAARELNVRSPLVEAGLNKADVRNLALHWQLPVWDKPATPCLSSRLAYGLTVTPERVQRIDAAERFLRQLLNIRELRVRLEPNELARIELPVSSIPQVCDPETLRSITRQLKSLGFKYVTLDLEGFRSGSMNDALPLVQLAAWKS